MHALDKKVSFAVSGPPPSVTTPPARLHTLARCRRQQATTPRGDPFDLPSIDVSDIMSATPQVPTELILSLYEYHPADVFSCTMCGKLEPPESEFSECGRCAASSYCSKDCQVYMSESDVVTPTLACHHFV